MNNLNSVLKNPNQIEHQFGSSYRVQGEPELSNIAANAERISNVFVESE